MIKELVLSLALAAASGVPFLDSPKKTIPGSFYLTVSFEGQSNGSLTTEVWIGETGSPSDDSCMLYGDDSYTFENYGAFGDITVQAGGEFHGLSDDTYFYFDVFTNFRPSYSWDSLVQFTVSLEEDGDQFYLDFYQDGETAFDLFDRNEPYELSITISEYQEPEYTLSKTFTNCAGYIVGSGGVLSPLPDTYTSLTLQNPYTCRFYASEGYYFDNRTVAANIMQSGGIVIEDVVFDTALNNDRYTTGFSCSITLPLANCSLSAVANAHTYTITSELNRCSVSGLPSSYTNELAGTYVFIAAANNGFNRNTVSYEITGATYEVSYSGVLYGDFYQNLTISIEAHFSDVTIRVTAVSYDPEPYQQGYQDGYSEGYSQGKIAGDSYGVWNWLKQAARTTGEFLNIPLLPGFSIGGLLTALAGLVIIWLFIKGFLFKS